MIDFDWIHLNFKNFEKQKQIKKIFDKQDDLTTLDDITVVSGEMIIPQEKKNLVDLLNYSQVFSYSDCSFYIDKLFDTDNDMLNQFDIDFNRHCITINGNSTNKRNDVLYFIDYYFSTHSELYKARIKTILTCCTQAILSIPMKGVHDVFNLEDYILGEMNSSIDNYDRTMYININLQNNGEWSVNIKKIMRLFDMHNTLYYILIDMDVDSNGFIITTHPFS